MKGVCGGGGTSMKRIFLCHGGGENKTSCREGAFERGNAQEALLQKIEFTHNLVLGSKLLKSSELSKIPLGRKCYSN